MSLLRPKFIKLYFYANVMESILIRYEKGLIQQPARLQILFFCSKTEKHYLDHKVDLWLLEAEIQVNYYHSINNNPGKPNKQMGLPLICVMKKKTTFVTLQKTVNEVGAK